MGGNNVFNQGEGSRGYQYNLGEHSLTPRRTRRGTLALVMNLFGTRGIANSLSLSCLSVSPIRHEEPEHHETPMERARRPGSLEGLTWRDLLFVLGLLGLAAFNFFY
jgi:hypothetical protein